MTDKLYGICGPTASGKTALAIEVAKLVNGEIVSADSMQIYKGMDILSAKPTQDEMQGIRHHMIGVIETDASYSASKYREDASKIIEDIKARGKTPILCGGTGLYIESLLSGRDFADRVCVKYFNRHQILRASSERR